MITHHQALKDFPNQIDFVLERYANHGITLNETDQVVCCGLGGSGIALHMVKNWGLQHFPLPVEVVNDYHLPGYVNEKSLIILNSYSGNTEETLQAAFEARETKCKVIVLSSGGKLTEMAGENNWLVYSIEPGYQPRQTLGYSFATLLMVFAELKDAQEEMRDELKAIAQKFKDHHEEQVASAEQIFSYFKNRLESKFVIIADSGFAPAALRFCQQLNENAKCEAYVQVIPEINHNVLESMNGTQDTNYILLYSEYEPRVAARFDFVQSHLEMDNNKVLPLFVADYTLSSVWDMNYRLDWVSVFAAEALGTDMNNVPNIEELKDFLGGLVIEEAE